MGLFDGIMEDRKQLLEENQIDHLTKFYSNNRSSFKEVSIE